MQELNNQIESAFDYRGNVTISFNDNKSVEGFLFNRDFDVVDPFIEVYLVGNGDPKRYLISDIKDVSLSGEDYAAGKSYGEWLKKEEAKTSNH